MTLDSVRPARPEPAEVTSRAELGAALNALRDSAGLSVRELVEQADGFLGTLSGWLSGAHAPTAANRDLFNRVLAVCGVPEAEFDDWWGAVARARVRTRTKTIPAAAGKPPYRGFAAFDIGDADLFFGRDGDAAALHGKLVAGAADGAPRYPIILSGGSGIGKSSVARAGLARAFAAARGPGSPVWDQVVITPGVDSAAAIDEAQAALRERGAAHRVLVVDQLEEVWTLGTDDEAQLALARLLALAADGSHAIVLVIRSDFLDRLVAEPGYAEAAAAGTVVIGPLDRAGLRAAITGPAERAAVTVDPALVDLLLDDAEATGDAAGVLPLLSHALLTTWEASGRSTLTVAGYLETGRLAGAVEKSAEAVYGQLDGAGRLVMHDLLLDLMNVEEQGITRRIASVADLDPDSETGPVLDRLVAARLLTVGDDGVQLAHEALVRAWPRLGQWVEENRARLRLEHRIRVSAAHWRQAGEPETLLLSSGMLDLITSLSVERPSRWGAVERRMIEASIARREGRADREHRQLLKLRAVAVTAAAFALIAVLAAVLAWVGLTNTTHARDAAAQAHAESTSRQLALESRRLRPRDSALAAQLAVAAYRISPTIEARSNLLDTLSDPLATRHLIGGPFEVAAARSGELVAIRTERRVQLRRVDAHGLGAQVGEVDIVPGPETGSGLAFTADGAALLVGTGRGIVEVDTRDPGSPRVARTVDTPGPVAGLSISDDAGTVLASLVGAPPQLLHRAAGWRAAGFPADGYDETAAAVALRGDARVAAVSTPGAGIALWDVSGAAPVRSGSIPLGGASNQAVRMTFHGTALAAGLRSREAIVAETADPAAPVVRRTVAGFSGSVDDVEFAADGEHLVATGSEGLVKVVSLTGDPTELQLNNPEPTTLTAVAGDTLLTATDGGVLRTWPLRNATVALGTRSVFQIAVHGSDVLVANGGADSAVGQWRAGPGPELVRVGPDIAPPAGELFSGALALSPDGTVAVLGSATGRVYLADLRERSRPRLSRGAAAALRSIVATVAVSPDGRTALVAGPPTPRAALLDISDRDAPRVVGSIDVVGGVAEAGFTSDRRAALGTVRGDLVQVDVGDPASPRVVRSTHVFDAPVAALAVAPRGGTLLLASTGGDQLAQVEDADGDDQPRITRFTGPTGSVHGAAFSPDGSRLVVAASSGEARLYRIADGAAPRREATLSAEEVILFDARFTGDGARVVASGNSGRLQAWDLDPQRVIRTICSAGSAPISAVEWDRLVPGEPFFAPCP